MQAGDMPGNDEVARSEGQRRHAVLVEIAVDRATQPPPGEAQDVAVFVLVDQRRAGGCRMGWR
jgi:hypothetical protein